MYSIPSHKSCCAKQIQYLIFGYSTVAHVPHFLKKFCWFAISNIPLFRPFQLVLVILTPKSFSARFPKFPPTFCQIFTLPVPETNTSHLQHGKLEKHYCLYRKYIFKWLFFFHCHVNFWRTNGLDPFCPRCSFCIRLCWWCPWPLSHGWRKTWDVFCWKALSIKKYIIFAWVSKYLQYQTTNRWCCQYHLVKSPYDEIILVYPMKNCLLYVTSFARSKTNLMISTYKPWNS